VDADRETAADSGRADGYTFEQLWSHVHHLIADKSGHVQLEPNGCDLCGAIRARLRGDLVTDQFHAAPEREHECADHAVTDRDGTSFCPVCERRARELEAVEAHGELGS
jgi:hypothetical protein